MSWFQEVITENPMMSEVSRFASSLKGKGLSAVGLRALIGIAVIISALLVFIVANSRGYMPPSIVLVVQLIVCGLSIALRYYGVIAGERERRSWDLLRVAPITNAQVVVGKFAGMGLMVLIIHAVFLLPLFMAMLPGERMSGYYSGGLSTEYEDASFPRVLAAEVYSLIVCAFMASLVLFFSARVRRAFGALGLSLGFCILLFIIFPALASMATRDSFFGHILSPWPTLMHLGQKQFWAPEDYDRGALDSYSFCSFVIYSVLAVFMLVYAVKTLAFADNNIRFVRRRK